MSYTPTSWSTGDTITAAAMNKIENGIANAGGGVSGLCTDTDGTLNKTYNEIVAMITAGTLPFLFFEDATDTYSLLPLYYIGSDGVYEVDFLFSSGDTRNYISSTADGDLELD